jgi:hypothetical protein
VPSTRELALVSLKGSPDFVVRDVTDINHPYTVSSPGNQVDYAAQFVNAGELSVAVDGTGLVRMPLSGSPKTVISPCGTRLFAWSPDGTAAAYVGSTQVDPQLEALHIVSGGWDTVVDTLRNPIQGGFGCESRSSCSSWAFKVLYSPNGGYISVVQVPGTGLHVWTSSGKLVLSATAASTLPVWSGETLYWRDDKGVEMWRNGAQSLVLPGVGWIGPHASATGGMIVYESKDPGTFTSHVHLLDTATGKTREVAQSRSFPGFLTPRYIWYLGERPCASTEPCIDPTISTGITYIYDLQTGTEYQSIISNVFDVWPHPA